METQDFRAIEADIGVLAQKMTIYTPLFATYSVLIIAAVALLFWTSWQITLIMLFWALGFLLL